MGTVESKQIAYEERERRRNESRARKKEIEKKLEELKEAYNYYISVNKWRKAHSITYYMYQYDKKWAYEIIKELRLKDIPHDVLFDSYQMTARDYFEDFLIYIDHKKEISKRFYLPRQFGLKRIVEQLQRLEDDEIDRLCISCPPGIGKTALETFFLCWVSGRKPDMYSLMGSHSTDFLKMVYNECQRIITELDYSWTDIFPDVKIVGTDASRLRIDLNTHKSFETMEFSSIGSGNAGKVRCNNYLFCDDLISGIEVASSKERLDKVWSLYTTDLHQRKIGKCKEVLIMTRWSLYDPIGRLHQLYDDDERTMFYQMDALNERNMSNFDYPYNLGFSTDFYLNLQKTMDKDVFNALYMNSPVEKEGILYNSSELRRYSELPSQIDGIISVCDTKDRGQDYCVMPVAFISGQDMYIEEILCDNSAPEMVEARLVSLLCEKGVQMSRFESNSAGGKIAEKIQKGVKDRGGKTKITTKFTTGNKETRIIVESPFIKQHCLFKFEELYSPEYRKAMGMLTSYTMASKNRHDDVPDAFAMLSDFFQTTFGTKNNAVVMKRWF